MSTVAEMAQGRESWSLTEKISMMMSFTKVCECHCLKVHVSKSKMLTMERRESNA